MTDYNTNRTGNPGNQKQYKGQQRKDSRAKGGKQSSGDIPPFLKGLLDELAPAIKNYLNQAAESRAQVAAARERSAQAVEKLIENLPEILQQTAPTRRAPRKRKINARKQELLDLINKLRDDEMTYEEIAAYLEENKIPTFSGRGRWHAQTIHRLYMYYP